MRIAVIGAGNVASHLAVALAGRNEVVQVMARTEESASRLADKVNAAAAARTTADGGSGSAMCAAITDPAQLRADCDFYLVSVNDDAVADVAASTPDFPGIWAHTSGSVPMDVFAGKKSRYGVFYPLQTFSRDLPVKLDEVAMLIEGSDAPTAESLSSLAGEFSRNVKMVDSEGRRNLHVAAVYACNFANLMWLDADRLLHEKGLDITIFRPLLRATLDKLDRMSPEEAMTGPARRGDVDVIHRHLTMLPDSMKPVYSLLSQSILDIYHPEKHI